MKEQPIIFSTESVPKLLDDSKTQSRRVIKPQPVKVKNLYEWGREDRDGVSLPLLLAIDEEQMNKELIKHKYCPYGQVGDRLWCKQNYLLLNEDLLPPNTDILYRLTDDRIYAILTMEVQNGRYKTDEWNPSQAYPNLPQQGLHGGVGWSNLLTNKIQRLWAEGIRGLVSTSRTQQRQGLSDYINVPSEPQDFKECPSPDMYGFSWDATIPIFSNETFRRLSTEQSARQSMLGNTRGKLDGQEGAWTWERRRKAPDGKINRLRDEGVEMGNRERLSQPAPRSKDTWNVAGWHIRSCPSATLKLKPSIHMPRWASRITLEITEVRAERLQEITVQDAMEEGFHSIYTVLDFKLFWDSLNAKYPWESNPWVWIISFRRIM